MKENEDARRLSTIPGIGAIVASALVAAIGQAERFDRGRDLAAWLGLVPRQFTTGGKPKQQARQQIPAQKLIHGARAALPYVAERDTPLGRWAKELSSRAHRNVVSSPSPTSRRGSPGRCCDTQKGSPPQERRWRPSANRCLREGDDGIA